MKEPRQKERNWVAKKDLMRYLKISQRALENYVNQGLIPSYRLGGRVFFDLHEIDDIIAGSRSKQG